MRLSHSPDPFDSDEFIYELKIDGFRALAYVENGQCDLVSRNGNTFRNFKDLAQWIGGNLRVENAVLAGEIACVDDSGRSVFNDLLFRRRECVFFAFDLLFLNGEDLRALPLIERKARLKRLLRLKRYLCFTWITSKQMVVSSSRRSANSIWRASWRSGSRPHIERPRRLPRTGSKSRTRGTRRLKAATSFSIRSLTDSLKFDLSA
jgi:ATP-dependent DNA ligase